MNFVSSGNGSASHLAGELFKVATQVNITHVPYKGSSPALIDMIAGRVQMMFSPLAPVLQHIKGGRLRALAVIYADCANGVYWNSISVLR